MQPIPDSAANYAFPILLNGELHFSYLLPFNRLAVCYMCIKKSVINTGSAHLILQIRYPINKLGRSWDLAEATVDNQSLSSGKRSSCRPPPARDGCQRRPPAGSLHHHLKYLARYIYNIFLLKVLSVISRK